MVRLTDDLDMIIAFDWDVKLQTKTLFIITSIILAIVCENWP